MVEVFREVRRILRADGVCFVNLGDSYNAARSGGHPGGKKQWKPEQGKYQNRSGANVANLKPKDLVGIPWRVALALQADGWWLRSDIIWAKPNPMPESVTDRPTKSHEYVFLLSKSARYFYDADAVRDESDKNSPFWKTHPQGQKKISRTSRLDGSNDAAPNTWLKDLTPTQGRNRRTIWTIATQAFSAAHFATFPTTLVEPMIKAGTAPGDTVLDPFFGAGTVGLVADRLGRDCIGIELNPEYAEMARKRIADDAGWTAEIEVQESAIMQLEIQL